MSKMTTAMMPTGIGPYMTPVIKLYRHFHRLSGTFSFSMRDSLQGELSTTAAHNTAVGNRRTILSVKAKDGKGRSEERKTEKVEESRSKSNPQSPISNPKSVLFRLDPDFAR